MSDKRLLVVDADPAVHDLLSTILPREGHTIEDAFDGHQALEHLKANPCDLVVAGQGNNGLGGVNLLRRLRAVRPDTKVIVAGELSREQVVGAIRHRAYSYFHKPLPAVPWQIPAPFSSVGGPAFHTSSAPASRSSSSR